MSNNNPVLAAEPYVYNYGAVQAAVRRVMADDAFDPGMEEQLKELVVADYVVFLLAIDTYMRYLTERFGSVELNDPIIHQGLALLKVAERAHLEAVTSFVKGHLVSPSHIKMLEAAVRPPPTAGGAVKRAFLIRTILSKGGTSVMRAVFDDSNKARREVKDAIEASMMEDEDKALDKFSAITLRNKRLEHWIDKAAEAAVPGSGLLNDVQVATKSVSDDVRDILKDRVEQDSQTASQETISAGDKQSATLARVEAEATEAVQRVQARNQVEDKPLTRSEVVGVAKAVAMSVVTDPELPTNIPQPLRNLDPEQLAAALTDGKVLVAAGAGAGKSTTLVARVEYLVRDRNAAASKIFVTSFNAKAANELKHKIGKAVGVDSYQQMSIGTMHSLFRSFISEYGTQEERIAIGAGDVKKREPNGFMQGGGSIAGAVNRAWVQCFKTEPAPKAKTAMRYKSLWAGSDISVEEAKQSATTEEESKCAVWYEWYEGFKGAIPGWKPPCPSREWETFNTKKRPGGIRLGDFDDMLNMFRDILKRDPAVRKKLQGMFDHILVDECQDLNKCQFEVIEMMSEHITDGKDGRSLWMVGDDKQCVSEDTLISTPEGSVEAKTLKAGDRVLSYRNGAIVSQTVKHAVPTSWTWGFKVMTASGKSLTMSPNHKIWASDPVVVDDQMIVYLMYRSDMGFRVGISNKAGGDEDYLNRFGGRAFMEKAERLWVLDICPDREKAMFQEEVYSLTYGIPTMVFGADNRGVNQERADDLFRIFGKNGGKLLEAKHLSFDLPHWMSQTYTKHGRLRRTIQMIAHSASNTQVSLEWMGSDLEGALSGVAYKTTGDRHRLRRYFSNYREALSFAEDLQVRTGALFSRRLSGPEGALRLLTASGIFPGMEVVVQDGDSSHHEVVSSVERVDGKFLDLDVEDASNFFGGGILSHNSIYGFRGARPEMFTGLNGNENWKSRFIRTNYRCTPEIVEAANHLISNNTDQIPMQAVPDARKSRGVGSVRVNTPGDEASAAIEAIHSIKMDLTSGGGEVTDYAILTRTNAEQHSYETACIIRGIPYARKGASSFLGSPETKAFLSYVQLATGDDSTKMQASLKEVINKPNRFFMPPDRAALAVEKALADYSYKSGQNRKNINVTVMLQDVRFQQLLVEAINGGKSTSSFKMRKDLEKVQDMVQSIVTMRANSGDPEYKTTDLFGEILSLAGTTSKTDPATGQVNYVEQTFRESLETDLKNSTSEDGEEEDESDGEEDLGKGLGNISFLFDLARVDPTDADDLSQDPNTPLGFKAKMERYSAKARDLRVDTTKWDKEQAALPPDQRKPPPGVYIGTIHSVKGAQWKNCFVQMPKGKFPFVPKVKPGDPPPPPEKVEAEMRSERRLAYVALTRAAVNLTVICPSSINGKPAGVSPFVAESQLKVGENVKRPGDEDVKTASLHSQLGLDGFDGHYDEGPEYEDDAFKADEARTEGN